MKKMIPTLVALTILLIAATVYCVHSYFQIDKRLYYYGINRFDRYEPINGRVIPINGAVRFNSFGNPFGNYVELWDEDELTMIAPGFKYYHYADIVVDSLVSYGFNDTCVVAEFIAKDQRRYYVVFDDSNEVKMFAKDTCANISPEEYFHLNAWYASVNQPPKNLTTQRLWFGIGSIALCLLSLICFATALISGIIKRVR